jgi:hypothetical protein
MFTNLSAPPIQTDRQTSLASGYYILPSVLNLTVVSPYNNMDVYFVLLSETAGIFPKKLHPMDKHCAHSEVKVTLQACCVVGSRLAAVRRESDFNQ